jgi:hypothetical protein
VVVVLILAAAVAADRGARTAPEGVIDVPVTSRRHLSSPVNYEQSPPAGGDHAPTWQNCDFYDQPISNETAVHSLEHGAVWVQYAADLPQAARDEIERLTERDPYILASPFKGLDSPVVLSAWGKRLAVDGAGDPRIDTFLEAFVQGPQTPERGAACSGGVG